MILFISLSIILLIFLVNEYKNACILEKIYMEKVEFPTWGNDEEVSNKCKE